MSDTGAQTATGTATAPAVPDAKTIRVACISTETRKKYTGNINGIKRWIRNELCKEDSNTGRFFDESDDINPMEFTHPWLL
ncbi:hypothetical protein PHMEG_00029590 [Phytophthora megakarya]|uniref:Uncharacterized protein n=1 Tax=Phytophthora megakarya TaxID=4795 RepID=A0A225V384_9STRA|nr:hypothetical protein PHMEG_00029590 [Phytophthora megakarya]